MGDEILFDPKANLENDKKKGYTDITVILDRSGSMNTVLESTISGFNKFIEEQKAVKGRAKMTLVQFDDKYEVVYKNKDIQKVPELTAKTFIPRGGTALLDAIGLTVASKKETIMNAKEKPANVVMVVMTDGEENQSVEYKHDQVQKIINDLKEHWQFVFLGAGQDAIQQATNMGFNPNMAAHYANNAHGVSGSIGVTSRNVTMLRANFSSAVDNNMIMSYTAHDRAAMVDDDSVQGSTTGTPSGGTVSSSSTEKDNEDD